MISHPADMFVNNLTSYIAPSAKTWLHLEVQQLDLMLPSDPSSACMLTVTPAGCMWMLWALANSETHVLFPCVCPGSVLAACGAVLQQSTPCVQC